MAKSLRDAINHVVYILLMLSAAVYNCRSTYFNGYAHFQALTNNENPRDIHTHKYNHYLHGQMYEISVWDAMIYFSILIGFGMCIGAFIKCMEKQCNQAARTHTRFQHIKLDLPDGLGIVGQDVNIKVAYEA
mmetsp:Transcript_31755/g.51387  ORF Transcript_31755/g.51387 Transcript_31755/m.51387 type:complete len:132 (-) Transcript_31755:581-976(-)